MDANTVAMTVALLGFVTGIVTLFIQDRRDKRKDIIDKEKIESEVEITKAEGAKLKSEAIETSVNTALSLVAPLKERITELECQLREVIQELQAIEELLAQKDNRIERLEEREKFLMDENVRLSKLIVELNHQLIDLTNSQRR
jgi:chromosome segregation ATPase